MGLALPADPTTAALGRHRPACAMRCNPATPRPTQLRGFPARLSLPPTMPAPTRLHPNPLPTSTLPSLPPNALLHLPRDAACLRDASPPCRTHSPHVIARDKRAAPFLTTSASLQPQLILTTSASPYAPQLILIASASRSHAHSRSCDTLGEQPRPRASQCSENLRASQCSQ
eukprot:scaffold105757_cov63-Phaeocystis_antarctica.AAC.1